MKVFIITTMLSPYRIDFFNELGKFCELTVCFETKAETGRHENWYKNKFENFNAIILANWNKPQWIIRADIIKYMNYKRYDVAIAFEYSSPTALLFILVNQLRKKPYCINLDGGYISYGKLKTIMKRRIITRAAACLASGKMAAQYFSHYGAAEDRIFYHNFTSLKNGDILEQPISADTKLLLKSQLNIPGKKTVLSVGRFIHSKGYDVLIKAWKNVNPDYYLILIGNGEMEKEYIQLIQELNLKNVRIVEFKEKADLIIYYQACELFVLPTRRDAWGLVINEAMAFGLPVITTDKCIAGLELVTDNENGFIVPVDRADILANRIEEVMSDEQLSARMSVASLEKIKPYTVEKMASQILSSLRIISKNV